MEKNKTVLSILISVDLSWDGPGIISAPNIANLLDISVYQVRKELQKLKEKGYVESDHVVIDKEYTSLPYRGFKLTNKFRLTKQYKDAQEEDIKIMRECFEC